jgi:hypothetical protein
MYQTASDVQFILDLTGRHVTRIWDGELPPGQTEINWNGVDRTKDTKSESYAY